MTDGAPGGRLRIAYLAHGVAGSDTGVHAKILAQARTWAKLDPAADVGIFVRCEAGAEEDWRGQPHVVSVTSSARGIAGRLVARERLSFDLARWRPDVIYHRQSTVSPSVVVLMMAIPTVMELNTLDLAELRLRSPLRWWWARMTRDLALRLASGIVAVSHEIAADPSVVRLRRPVTVVPNGVDLEVATPLPPTGNAQPRLVFVGTPGLPWHGVDRIEELAARFPDWTFDVVGPKPHELSRGLPNVSLHGSVTRAALAPLLARSDVAIGPLALHRKQMQEASPLKVGDYLAAGLPVIGAYRDTRFPDGAPFILRLPNTEGNIERGADVIEQFVATWLGRRVARGDIAAIDNLALEAARLAFIRQCSAGRARRPRGASPAAGWAA